MAATRTGNRHARLRDIGEFVIRRDTPLGEREVRVDALGRERLRVTLDRRSIERRADASDGDPIGFVGHAAVFNSPTWIGSRSWGYQEQLAEGAFAKTIGEADVRFLINHDPNLLLARSAPSRNVATLRMAEDDTGLATDADMSPTTYARDLAINLDAGNIDQMSFAFEVVKETWEVLDDDSELRTIQEVKLWDVSVVTYPAYEDTDAALRAAAFQALCRSAELDERAQRALLRSLTEGRDAEALNPVLRAAEALAEQTHEPPARTREPESDDQPQSGRRELSPAARKARLSMLKP